MKLKNVWDVILKVLTHVRTHPEELLVPVIWFSLFFENQKAKMKSLAIWKIEKCLECHPESSHQCKNSSRRTPHPKNLIFVVFHLFSQKSKRTLGRWENVFRPYDGIESCTEWKVESSHTCKNSSRRTPRLKNFNLLFFEDKSKDIWRTVVDIFLVHTYFCSHLMILGLLRKRPTSNKKVLFR